ncbi:MAG: fluoride efflux transporter CrcB [Herpetosiphonaceae bacterium]|nr:fluoride efflux transporter CrcB [Herpetosiphonaceae bacterium]
MNWLWLATGGVCGALCRFHGARLIQARWRGNFPVGSLVINLTGCCLLGLLTGLFLRHSLWPVMQLRLLLATGFCGAYTTFSSFAFEAVQLWRQGQRRQALLHLVGQPLVGVGLAWSCLLWGRQL